MPSISTILSGYVFQSTSVFMVYMIPAIWIGNFILIFIFKWLFVKNKRNYFFTGLIGVICKVLIIFSFFSFLNFIGIFPAKIVANLKTAMSINQAITASIGVMVSYVFYLIYSKKV